MVSLKFILFITSCAVLGVGAVPYRAILLNDTETTPNDLTSSSEAVKSSANEVESASNEVEAISHEDEDDYDYDSETVPNRGVLLNYTETTPNDLTSSTEAVESASNEVEDASDEREDDYGFSSQATQSEYLPVFSDDYTYLYHESWAGFLKVHRYPQTWKNALLRCRLEGSVLSTPRTEQQLEVFHNLMKKNKISSAYTGLHDLYSNGDFVTIEGTPLTQLRMNWSEYEPDNYNNEENCLMLERQVYDGDAIGLADQDCSKTAPFICYQEYSNDLVVPHCNTVDQEYEYNDRTSSCFKFHGKPQTWSRAYTTCTAEGGRLPVPNSFEKLDVLKKIFARHPERSLSGDMVLLGFSDILEEGRWQTLDGTLILGQSSRKDSHCGAMWRNATLTDVSCDDTYAFICEI